MKRHAPYLVGPLQEKLRAAMLVGVDLCATDGETLLVTGGGDEENLTAATWVCDRLHALGAIARMVNLQSRPPRRAVTWGDVTQNNPMCKSAVPSDETSSGPSVCPAHAALSLIPPHASRRPAMVDAITFSSGLRALVFSQCHHEDRSLIADVEVAALDPSTIEVSGDDVTGVAKFAGLALSILRVRHAGNPVQYTTKVTQFERGAAISLRWQAVDNPKTLPTSDVELPRTGIRKCAIPQKSAPTRSTSFQARGGVR